MERTEEGELRGSWQHQAGTSDQSRTSTQNCNGEVSIVHGQRSECVP